LIGGQDPPAARPAYVLGEGAPELIHIGKAALNLKGHYRLFHPEYVQLSDAGGSLQDRWAGCLQPDDAMTFVDATDLRVC
jgi:hypothetical protein